MLSDDRIAEMMRDTWGCASIAPRHAEAFARSVEAEVRKDYEALMRRHAISSGEPSSKSRPCAAGGQHEPKQMG